MKKLVFLLSLSLLILAGCSDMGTDSPVTSDQAATANTVQWKFMDLPDISADNYAEVEATFYTGKFVWGDWGANIPMTRVYWSGNGLVKVKAKLNVPAGAFDGLKLIWYSVNDELAVADFHPGMEFDKDLTFNLKIQNIDVSDITDPSLVEFAYLDDSEVIHIAEYDDIIVDLDNGELEVVNAKIGHFSRYGFVRGIE